MLLCANAGVLFSQQPAPPAGVVVGQINLTLQWTPNAEPDLAGYKVYFGVTSGKYGPPTAIGSTNTITLYGFASGQYFFAVTAYNTAGLESGYSNEVTATVMSPAAPPVPTQNIQGPQLVNVAATTAQLSWKSLPAATSRIEYQTAGGPFVSLIVNTDPVTDHWVRLTGLAGNSVYNYTVICQTSSIRYETVGSFKTR